MAAILSSRQTFSPEVILEVEHARKIAISISDIWAFDRRSSSNIDGDMSISKFDLLCHLQRTCKILFVWHKSFIAKSSGQTSWQT